MLFNELIPDDRYRKIRAALDAIKEKSLFEHDMALHMAVAGFAKIYLQEGMGC
jgi:hypothetical protein